MLFIYVQMIFGYLGCIIGLFVFYYIAKYYGMDMNTNHPSPTLGTLITLFGCVIGGIIGSVIGAMIGLHHEL
ncbi:hypothetical protein QKC54_gp0117 [Megavirus baoshan]|uniref:Uncharacterized protein n=1 Tax=Megavirus baoshan TaxID=2496520 RepID=A0A8K1T133_9VIRU|nr:hypothetical protein QKC54_gp0117 [Megavirus baoshan]UFX99901.1 hypothetical protein Mb0955 [Megavirus baoshan]